MFKFNLPKWAMIDVQLPTGAVQRMIHIGNGEFLSEIPPIAVHGLAPAGEIEHDAVQPVTWDSTINGRTTLQAGVLMFDVRGAMAALQEAEARGDVAAISLLQRLRQAEATADDIQQREQQPGAEG